ncbi:MAG: extracellular solute-binding protein [Planctomycetota bacterium]
MNARSTLFLAIAAAVIITAGCSKNADDEKEMVLYVAGDSIFSEEVTKEFEEKTGIKVSSSYDEEFSRGIKHRIKIEKEKDNPRADVYWNNEIVNTILLQKKGLLAQYKSESGKDIPEKYVDSQGFWTGFGLRARVFLVNTDKVKPEDMPKTYEDLLDPKWKGKVGMAKPDCGTTATHAATLFELWGDKKAKKFFQALKENEVVLCNGNAHVKNQVSAGELHWGWTDTNDANVAILGGKPVKVVYPDQGEGQIGTLLIPHTVCLIKGAPHAENGKKFIDFLLSKETEKKLAHSRSVQIPVREGVDWSKETEKNFIMKLGDIKAIDVDFAKVADRLEETIKYLSENFIG